MNYLTQNTPKSLVDEIGKKKGWKSTTSSGGTGGGSASQFNDDNE